MMIGNRAEEETTGLLSQLRDRLVEGVLPSDVVYPRLPAILCPITRKPSCRSLENGFIVSVTTQVIYGNRDQVWARLKSLGQTINTFYVERMNLTLRHLGLAYYHFVLHHSPAGATA